MGPAEYRGDQWPTLVERMKREKKIKIPEHEQLLMERYLVAFSSTAPRLPDAGVSVAAPTMEGTSSAAASR